MFKLWFISAAIVWFTNMSSKTIQSDHIRAELSYYSLSDQLKYQNNKESDGSFSIDGSSGVGLTLLTGNREVSPWRHTLTLRRYKTSDYQMIFYQTGLEYVTARPRRPLQQFVGFDISITDMDLVKLKTYGSMKESWGYGVHFGVEGYFISFEKLTHYFVSIGVRRQLFRFEAKDFPTQTLNGNGFEMATGLGIRF